MHLVKWEAGTRTRYGTIEEPGPDEQRPGPDVLFVRDAVMPVTYEVEQAKLVEILLTEFQQYQGQQYELAWRRGTKAKGLKGKLFAIPVGDGHAYYVVVGNGGRKNAQVEWRGFGPNNYVCPKLGCGKSLPREQVRRLVQDGEI